MERNGAYLLLMFGSEFPSVHTPQVSVFPKSSEGLQGEAAAIKDEKSSN